METGIEDTSRITGLKKVFLDSHKIIVRSYTKYRTKAKVIGINGMPNVAFFGVFILNQDGKELTRHIKWIDDFSSKEKEYEITFTTPAYAYSAVLGYRVNVETSQTGEVDIHLQDVDALKLEMFNPAINKYTPDLSLPALAQLTEDQEALLESKMIWIFGFQRSGTTWLGRDLLSHESMTYWHEPRIAWLLSQNYTIRSHLDYFLSLHHKNNWLPQFKKLVLMRTFSQVGTLDKTVVIKEPSPNNEAALLMGCFPKAKLVFIMRDGRDVIDSILDSHLPDSWRTKDPAYRLDPLINKESRLKAIHGYAEDWVFNITSMKQAYDNHDPSRRVLVRYEDLRKDTFHELKRLYDKLGMPITTESLTTLVQKYSFEAIPEQEKGSGKFYRSAKPGGWKEHFNDEEKAVMESMMGSLLKKFGYE